MRSPKKNILLISPSHSISAYRNIKKGDGIRLPMISLLYIAALTPEDRYNVEIVEEEIEDINFDLDCDLVGITTMTATAPRAYDIASEFKKHGKKVVMGGIHPTVLPNEAKKYCDSVVIGEAETVWVKLLADFEKNRLKPFYNGGIAKNIDNYPLPRRDLIKKPAVLNIHPIVSSRGCPYSCDFCSVWKFFGRRVRHVSIDRVVQDIKSAKTQNFMFLDDNIIGDRAYARELFKAIIPLGIRWVGQASISFVKDKELFNLLAKSGCKALFIGLESVSVEKIQYLKKGMKDVEETIAAVNKIREQGIAFHASLVFGMDNDEPSIFDETLEFMFKTKISSASFNILTPYPGTDVYERFKKQNRLITEHWKYYDHCTATFIPKNMTVSQLVEGYMYVREEFYKLSNIFKRSFGNWRHPLIYWIPNLTYRHNLRKDRRIEENQLQKLLSILAQKNLNPCFDETNS
jgi:radical SAM superfamily enzyme YgiQ (UPF0313 family)